MATWGQRAISIFEGVTDAAPTQEQQDRVLARFVEYAPDIAQAVIDARPPINSPEEPDTSPLTTGEKAEVMVKAFRRFGRSVVRAKAEQEAREDNAANVTAAGDTAEADL